MKSGPRAVLLLLPALIVLLALFAAPQLFLLEASFARRSAYGTLVHEWSLASYLRALTPLYLRIVARSVVLALATTGACLLLGYPVAYWIGVATPRARRSLLLTLVIMPFWTSFLVRMYAWIVLLRDEGVLNLGLRALGLPAVSLLYNDAGVLLGQVYGELPFMILPLFASLERLDRSLLEAAADLGAPPARVLWRVTVPLSAPGIVAGCVLVFIPSLGAYLAPDLLGGAREAYLGNLIQSQFAVARDMPFGAALSFLLSAVVLAGLWLTRRFRGRLELV
ncbi:MAG TPA: ABC transporter permease [Vicinamibacteria bacterium]|jgi:spermidine/putrescine transport system permease protein